MVNLVIVSHSKKLADGVAELAGQMVTGGCKIAVAAGIDDEENPIGTDAVKIMSAIEEVFSADGVVILVDLGSAILSAETALDLLDPEIAEKVAISYAPLVEGALAAAVSASTGDDLQTVLAEAKTAGDLKLQQENK
ncbi:dihydroxyacetone kinase phosphoryl donor subunit DhaM [Basfia succiniciproducens]|uniref:dihydroxyacetone kinase phosphoryl donor subunit DhaM n=1 Tax=Basfia succiniciproducens TaxID=653940 RepID=UPI003FCE7CB1